ncbi:hypothetical protein [Nocardia sp. NPDC005745]|uniref:hypothetical protein n=1 Tax=Nocardia sp. NPDC005745 TaxID=3157061 RepID=UPI0033D98A76
MARHVAEHRNFYRAVLTGSCAYPAARAVMALLFPENLAMARRATSTRSSDG